MVRFPANRLKKNIGLKKSSTTQRLPRAFPKSNQNPRMLQHNSRPPHISFINIAPTSTQIPHLQTFHFPTIELSRHRRVGEKLLYFEFAKVLRELCENFYFLVPCSKDVKLSLVEKHRHGQREQ